MEQLQMPRIGDKAPDFSAKTTYGDLTFSEFSKDKWVILFSHPADFTPVCTTELVEFAKNKDFFDSHNTRLMGISVDSVPSHLAWVKNVQDHTGVLLDFPIIADLDMKVSNLFGMLHPGASDTATVRAVFFIDPKGIVKLIMYYPMNIGRSMVEIKRTLLALQTADTHSVSCPVDWQVGEKVVIPPPKNITELQERLADTTHEKVDYYLMKKSL